ncbi:MAG TPA: ATP-binding domain-containing protein [Streptosporangiaceae bacterium]|nr:ATP-binding domain-containing protein [Streptosporangiaceae bacterium]
MIEKDLEQKYITGLYDRLDELRERAAGRLARVLRQAGGTPAARTEREALTVMYRQQLAQFDAAENGLCFGRMEFNDGARSYVGRLGMHADNDDYDQLLMDWRAEAARPFYLATAASPGEVRVRRHIKTRGRTVLRLDDEVLDLAAADPTRHEGLTGESALLAALNASRTGRMRDIVETIQAEQDRIIRAGLPGVLVVQGGPGTGKTAVALHRAAYLLYTYRRQLEKRGVLLVGPNTTFLRYIGQVLPSLGETSVLMATIGDLMPGIAATGTEPAEIAQVKGRAAMARVIAAAVRDRQRVPHEGVAIRFEKDLYRLSRPALARARERARRSRLRHNQARQVFAAEVIGELARLATARLGTDPLGGANLMGRADIDDLRAELRADPDVRAAIDKLWPVLTPRQLLTDLLASGRLLDSAASSLTAAQRALLRRAPGSPWTAADVPLLDEAAELLGTDDRVAKALARRQREEEEAYARGVLEIIGRDDEDDPEILMGADMLDAARLAARQESGVYLTAAERAAADRTWAFGHVIVDEAQELSPMAWRMLIRRCPAKSMTVVGDVAQTGDTAGARSWSEALGPHLGDRWRLAPLTVNYRTPAEIMTVAADVLAAIDPEAEPPRSVRESGVLPWRLAADPADLPGLVARAAERLAARAGEGTLAVIGPAGRLAELGAAVSAVLPDAAVGEQAGVQQDLREPDLERPVVVLTVRQAKGLEFDSVIVAEPGRILAESPRGLGDVYVALTRATQRLGVVYSGELPPVLGRLAELGSAADLDHLAEPGSAADLDRLGEPGSAADLGRPAGLGTAEPA